MTLVYILEIAVIAAGLCIYINKPAKKTRKLDEYSGWSHVGAWIWSLIRDGIFDMEHEGLIEWIWQDIQEKKQQRREKKYRKYKSAGDIRQIDIKGRRFSVASPGYKALDRYNEYIRQYNWTHDYTFLNKAANEVCKIYKSAGFLKLSKDEETFIFDWTRAARRKYRETTGS